MRKDIDTDAEVESMCWFCGSTEKLIQIDAFPYCVCPHCKEMCDTLDTKFSAQKVPSVENIACQLLGHNLEQVLQVEDVEIRNIFTGGIAELQYQLIEVQLRRFLEEKEKGTQDGDPREAIRVIGEVMGRIELLLQWAAEESLRLGLHLGQNPKILRAIEEADGIGDSPALRPGKDSEN